MPNEQRSLTHKPIPCSKVCLHVSDTEVAGDMRNGVVTNIPSAEQQHIIWNRSRHKNAKRVGLAVELLSRMDRSRKTSLALGSDFHINILNILRLLISLASHLQLVDCPRSVRIRRGVNYRTTSTNQRR